MEWWKIWEWVFKETGEELGKVEEERQDNMGK